ncbi:MAG: glycine oxidase ThiO [Acidobacteriota bacterium]
MSDVLIAGGGVIGLSLAYELSGRGARVTLIDKGEVGGEASWAGAGILTPASVDGADRPIDRLRALSTSMIADWSPRLQEETGIDNGYRRCGSFHVALDEEMVPALRREAADLQAQGVAVESVSDRELQSLEPALDGGFPLAYRYPSEAQIRNPWHVRALAVACRRRGVEVRTHCALSGWQISQGRITAAQTTAGALPADRFVLAAGAWSPHLLPAGSAAFPGRPMRGQIVLLEAPSPLFSHLVWAGPRYLVPRPDGKVLIGSTEEDAGFDSRPTAAGVAGLIALARRIAPRLEALPFAAAWAGLRPGSPDGLPLLGAFTGRDNLFLACGHFRAGFELSAGTARVMTELLLDGAPSLDLDAFHPDRF